MVDKSYNIIIDPIIATVMVVIIVIVKCDWCPPAIHNCNIECCSFTMITIISVISSFWMLLVVVAVVVVACPDVSMGGAIQTCWNVVTVWWFRRDGFVVENGLGYRIWNVVPKWMVDVTLFHGSSSSSSSKSSFVAPCFRSGTSNWISIRTMCAGLTNSGSSWSIFNVSGNEGDTIRSDCNNVVFVWGVSYWKQSSILINTCEGKWSSIYNVTLAWEGRSKCVGCGRGGGCTWMKWSIVRCIPPDCDSMVCNQTLMVVFGSFTSFLVCVLSFTDES